VRFAFDYTVVRVVPHVEREEFLNVGVILFCDALDFLDARIALDEERLRALAPDVDVETVRSHLEALPRLCAGGSAAGPIGALSVRERWRWLASPRSTVLQMSAPHSGLCDGPAQSLERLVDTLVRVRREGGT
jgi:hypothetical protein